MPASQEHNVMIIYYVFAAVILLIQTLLLLQAYRNLFYTRRTYRPKPSSYQPAVALITPCKGSDTTFDRNINALFEQQYPNYEIFFVVESRTDPAYARLEHIIRRRRDAGHPVKARLLVAGLADRCGQKVHNLLAAIEALPQNIDALAFVDSDACPREHFLASLVHPLRRPSVGAATGHRWYVPADARTASKTLSAINAFFASLLGPHPWNSAWGGAMAIRRDMFDALSLRQLWQKSLTDDYSLTMAVKGAKLQIIFVPACFVASYETTNWSALISFARRQFVITRRCRPKLWLFGLFGLGHFLAGFWIGVITTAVLLIHGHPDAGIAALLPAALMLSSMTKATARQLMIRRILPDDRRRLVWPALIDIFLGPIVHLLTFACFLWAGFSRTIVWRGIRYTIHAIDSTELERLAPPNVADPPPVVP